MVNETELKKQLNKDTLGSFYKTVGGCKHLPLDKKLQIISKLKFDRISVCDDVQEHYEYFLKNVCANPNDCCDLNI